VPSKIPEGKRQLNVLISEDLYKKLVEVATSRYGRAHGALSATVEEALTMYFGYLEKEERGESPPTPHTHRQNTRSSKHSRKLLGDKKVYETYQQVMALLREVKKEDVVCEINEYELTEAIRRVRGGDPRTIERWINDFLRYGLMSLLIETPKSKVYWNTNLCGKPD